MSFKDPPKLEVNRGQIPVKAGRAAAQPDPMEGNGP